MKKLLMLSLILYGCATPREGYSAEQNRQAAITAAKNDCVHDVMWMQGRGTYIMKAEQISIFCQGYAEKMVRPLW